MIRGGDGVEFGNVYELVGQIFQMPEELVQMLAQFVAGSGQDTESVRALIGTMFSQILERKALENEERQKKFMSDYLGIQSRLSEQTIQAREQQRQAEYQAHQIRLQESAQRAQMWAQALMGIAELAKDDSWGSFFDSLFSKGKRNRSGQNESSPTQSRIRLQDFMPQKKEQDPFEEILSRFDEYLKSKGLVQDSPLPDVTKEFRRKTGLEDPLYKALGYDPKNGINLL